MHVQVRGLLAATITLCTSLTFMVGCVGDSDPPGTTQRARRASWQPLPVSSDPLVRMPGTQPAQNVALESPNRCLNCHADYNQTVEPGFNWKGSMMAHAARDFLFFAALTVAAQDSVWAIGRPNATDLCLRCHMPGGWLGGRSDPTNGSALTGADWDGVQCDFCHTKYDPFYSLTKQGLGDSADWVGYWDETNASSTPSSTAANLTYDEDRAQAVQIKLFNGNSFFVNDLPLSSDYTVAVSGQFFVSGSGAKRGPFADASARHQMLYSRYHKSRNFCATCHDVSNPVLANLSQATTAPGDGTTVLTSEKKSASSYFHVERTFSEFKLSAYGRGDGAPGVGPFAPDVFRTSLPGNLIGRCQDCHMRDVTGVAANKKNLLVRPTDSVEHPKSGQPLHDLTGGNIWVSRVLASAVAGSSVYDATNAALLNRPSELTLDLTAGLGIDPVALLAGVDRAKQQLALAARIGDVSYSDQTGALSFRVYNHTGHKLISGFPEGRRLFVNVRVFDGGGALVHEINPYDSTAGTLKGLGVSGSPALGTNEVYADALVYEMKPKSTLTGESRTLHFVLADGRYKDNRIPPLGFDIDSAAARQAEPVWQGASAPTYYTAAEYAGGYDQVDLTLPTGAARVEIKLYYQVTSREFVAFLRNEINGTAGKTTLPASAYIAQTDAWFSRLRAWGDTIWALWQHNKDLPGAAPYQIAAATVNGASACTLAAPALQSAQAGDAEVTLAWSDQHSSDSSVVGYNVYYDQSGKAQAIESLGQVTSTVDAGLNNGQSYCYKVTARTATCESAFSNVLCATPAKTATSPSHVVSVASGELVTSGKGKNQTTTFVAVSTFTRGDTVTLRAHVVDGNTGLPLAGARVDFVVGGPQTTQTVTSAQSDSSGYALATWATQAPNRKGGGGTPAGSYTATVSAVRLDGTVWDGAALSTSFTLQ